MPKQQKSRSVAVAGKLDLYREFKSEYSAKKEPVLFAIAPAQYLSIEGRGEPGGEAFQEAAQALYGAAFTIKMTRKFAGLGDYKVCGLEGQWWADDTTRPFFDIKRSAWCWNLMIRTPDFIKQKDLDEAKASLAKKGKAVAAPRVQLVTIKEGECVQALHVGPYATEPQTITAMHAYAEAQGRALHGRHHEIYLNDPRRTAPEKLKTILRHPVRKA